MKYLSEFVRIRFRFLIRHSDPFFPLQLKPHSPSLPLPQPRLLGESLLESAAAGRVWQTAWHKRVWHVTPSGRWGGGGVRQVVSFALNLAALLPSTMCRHRICGFYLHFQASNNHLARCDKSSVGAGQALSLNLQHGILTTVSNHSFCCSIFPLSVRPFHISLCLFLC